MNYYNDYNNIQKYSNNKYDNNKNIQKYRNNIHDNNKNYLIEIFVNQEKLNISCKYSNDYKYSTDYSFRQLKIINKYFTSFKKIDEISYDLHKLLKKTKVSFEEKKNFLLLSIKTDSNNIIFKLLKNKINDISSFNSKLSSAYKDNRSISVPKNDKSTNSRVNINDIISYPLYIPLVKVPQISIKENENEYLNRVNKKKSYEDEIQSESIRDSFKQSNRHKKYSSHDSRKDKKNQKYDENSVEKDKKRKKNKRVKSVNNSPSYSNDEEFDNKKSSNNRRCTSTIRSKEKKLKGSRGDKKGNDKEKENQSRNIKREKD
jgi:hypothetical protein